MHIDLALALSNQVNGQEFHVLLILIILITTIFFCHSLIRLCMLALHPPAEDDDTQRVPSMVGRDGFARPQHPIRVITARDEEIVEGPSAATLAPPPAYGLWRSSVVSPACSSLSSKSLTLDSVLIRIFSTGNVTNRLLHVKTPNKKLQLLVPQPPIDLHLICHKRHRTEWSMSSLQLHETWRLSPTFLYLHIPPRGED